MSPLLVVAETVTCIRITCLSQILLYELSQSSPPIKSETVYLRTNNNPDHVFLDFLIMFQLWDHPFRP